MTAHNLNFNAPILFKPITSCSLVNDFSSVTEGFIDPLLIIRKVTLRFGKTTWSITSLVTWLKISCANALAVTNDAVILEQNEVVSYKLYRFNRKQSQLFIMLQTSDSMMSL